MKKLIALALLALASCAKPAPAPQPADVLPSIVKLSVSANGAVQNEGSGIAIAHDANGTVILTCAHVTDGANSMDVTYNKTTKKGIVIVEDKKADLALIEVAETIPAAVLYTGTVATGDTVLTAGYPLNEGEALSLGFIGPSDAHDGTTQTSASIWPGNSGGGAFVNHDGWKLAGVMEAVKAYPTGPFSGGLADTVSYFIPMERIQKFLKAHGVA